MLRSVVLAAAALLAIRPASAQDRGAAALGELIAGLGTTARVLVVGAHPDDEDSQLIAYLARGRHVETAYLSLTRGDGGQNLIGNELGEALGVIRTEELLAARRIDGAQQFFTRAYDFGFSKSAEETYKHWPKDSILSDVITVVRAFKPHIVVAVFSGTPRDGHGHHQVSGMLAREAFDLSGDTVKFPRAATAGQGPWTITHFYRGQRGNSAGSTTSFNVGEYSPLLGRSYAEIAGESRSQHKSQGFGALERKGAVMDYLRLEASRLRTPPGAPAPGFFDGIDTTFSRFRGFFSAAGRTRLDSMQASIAAARRVYNPFDPTAVIAPLGTVLRQLNALCPENQSGEPCGLPPNAVVSGVGSELHRSAATLRERAEAALVLAAGIAVEATVSREAWSAGAPVPIEVRVYNRGRRPIDVRGPAGTSDSANVGRTVLPDSSTRYSVLWTPPAPNGPWWLATPRAGDIFSQPITGLPENARVPPGSVALGLTVEGERASITVPVVYRYADPVLGEVVRPLAIVPAIAVTLDRAVEIAPAGTSYDRTVVVNVRSALAQTGPVRISLRLPSGLVPDSASRTIAVPAGGSGSVVFRLRGRLAAGTHQVVAVAEAGDVTGRNGFQLVDYSHIRPQRLYREATIAVRAVDVTVPAGVRVTYIPGVSDNVAPVLQQLGYAVTVVPASELSRADLAATDVVVVGPRAYEANETLVAQNPRLFEFVRGGGTMVVQYGQQQMSRPGMMPFPVTVNTNERVTEEDAPVRILDRSSPLLMTPNRITDADFQGWVQERGLYMPRTFDPAYKTVLSINDPGENPLDSGILVARYGAGTYVYATLSFFRQLPAGVPGATRLFVNLLSAGQTARPAVP